MVQASRTCPALFSPGFQASFYPNLSVSKKIKALRLGISFLRPWTLPSPTAGASNAFCFRVANKLLIIFLFVFQGRRVTILLCFLRKRDKIVIFGLGVQAGHIYFNKKLVAYNFSLFGHMFCIICAAAEAADKTR